MIGLEMIAVAWAIETLFGWPQWVHRWISHPVAWIGWLIAQLELCLNKPSLGHAIRYALGTMTSILVIMATVIISIALVSLISRLPCALLVEAILASSLLAGRSLYDHVATVGKALQAPTIEPARDAVRHIVGRDPNILDRPGIVRAALESLAENTSDGVTAPLFWGALLGLPGIAAYKAVNTLDSMIGHRTERYHAFGGFAARLDDAMNWIPARLTGLLFVLASARWASMGTMVRDAPYHRSPNAGWPEAAMAGALGVRLSGPRVYGTDLSTDPWLNGDAPDPVLSDLQRGLRLYLRAMGLTGVTLAALAIFRGASS